MGMRSGRRRNEGRRGRTKGEGGGREGGTKGAGWWEAERGEEGRGSRWREEELFQLGERR